MKVCVALGGNALLQRGQELTTDNQRKNVKVAAVALAEVAKAHRLVITHGNGPQVGLLALQSMAYAPTAGTPLDVLGARTEGSIGYMIEQELGNLMPFEQKFATILTQVEVDPKDPAFDNPTKPIGPVYEKDEADALAKERGWSIAPDGDKWRRVVPSPLPKRIFEAEVIKLLAESNVIVICAGGGGIPTMYQEDGSLTGVEAVIDKDRAGELLARGLGAEAYLMLTDVPAVVEGYGTDNARSIAKAHPDALLAMDFAAGSMGPKVEAACAFAKSGGLGGIGQLSDALAMVEGTAGTLVSTEFEGLTYHE